MSLHISEEELREQFEEEFSQQLDDLLGLGHPKPSHISISMISRRNLPESVATGSHDDLIESLLKLTHVRLDREGITEIDNLELLGPVTNLYLQQNSISKIENLECMTALQFLTLAGNKIRNVENLKILDTLKLLDLSENRIADLNADELPKSLSFLDLRGNPCTQLSDYRSKVLAALPNLKSLDGELLTKEEKRLAGHPVSSDDDDDDDEEEEEEEEEGGKAVDGPDDINIQDVFRLSADLIHQSRERAVAHTNQHEHHMTQIEEVRSQSRQARATPSPSPRSGVTSRGSNGVTPRSHGDVGSRRYLTPSPASR